MNSKQRKVIIIGIILVVLCGLFPPFEGSNSISSVKIYMGYHFLFSQPSKEEVQYATGNIGRHYPPPLYSSNIITSRILIQVLIIVVLTVGFFFLFSGNKNKKVSRIQKE